MPEFNIAVVATFIAQTLGAAVMALLLLSFHRQYRKSYLLHWTFAWSALAVHHFATGVAMVLVAIWSLPPIHPLRICTTLVSSVSGYLQIGWFLFGVYELVKRRPVPFRHMRRLLIVLGAAGIVASFLFLTPQTENGDLYVTRIGIRAMLAAIAFFIASIALWRTRAKREGVGYSILAGAFALCGLEQLHYVTLGTGWSLNDEVSGYAIYLGYFDFMLQAVMGVGMIACLLEDEREAVELASEEIEHLAYHDALTGLPNRPLFIDRLIISLAQAHRANQKLAVFFLDLDRFKDINDSLGHTIGDALLKSVAERIRRCVRDGDTVARFGGDEFTVLVPRIENVEDAAKIAQKIIETLKIPFFISERELFVTTSIGVSISPNDGLDPETLVRNADTAMYRAKEQGRDNYQLYAPAMNARALERLALENMLRKALNQNELVLHYQPVVDPQSKAIVAVEALVRWQHPELGLIAPAHFIHVAEVSGLILPLGQWVLHTACRQIRSWTRRFNHDLTMSVNLSARQFGQPDLVEQIRAVLDETGIDGSRLQLEITESNAMQNADNSIYTLNELKSLGVRIAMDDFGTGYSSLSYLKRFPIDTLKLDQTFVHDVTTDDSDAAIVSAVIAMAHSLDLTVVAEGVETDEQLEFLRRQRCDLIQGFLFSKPLPAEEVERYLTQERAMTG